MTDPLLEHNDDDDDEGNTTTLFKPDYDSTPGPSGEEIGETSFIEGDTTYSRVITSNERAWELLTRIYPEAKVSELEVSYGKTGRLQVKMFGQGKKTYPLYTEEKGTYKQSLNPSLPKQIYNSLGPG